MVEPAKYTGVATSDLAKLFSCRVRVEPLPKGWEVKVCKLDCRDDVACWYVGAESSKELAASRAAMSTSDSRVERAESPDCSTK